ncbi:MAG: hypothetical protein ACRCYU_10785 [Nocardioides sp.]
MRLSGFDAHLRSAPRLERVSRGGWPFLWVGTVLFALFGCGADSGRSDGADRDRPQQTAGDQVPRSGGKVELLIDFERLPDADRALAKIETTVGEARIQVVPGADGVRRAVGADSSGAAQFPAGAEVAAGRRAVLRVTSPGSDDLAPGGRAFQFGVDVRYPADSAGDSAGDDGDNLIQRGLFGDEGQYKLQVDEGRPACRIAGVEGQVLVKARLRLASDQWYRLLCERTDDGVTLFAAEIAGSGDDLDWMSWTATGETGDIPAADPPASVSIGGKLNPAGGIVEDAPDQFSGVMDNVTFRVFAADKDAG